MINKVHITVFGALDWLDVIGVFTVTKKKIIETFECSFETVYMYSVQHNKTNKTD